MTSDRPTSKKTTKKASKAGQQPLRANKMARLSALVDDMIEPSVRKRGFVLSRLVSNWREIVGDTADWSKPVELKLDRKTHKDGVLKLSIASARGPQAQQLAPHIIDRVNAAFGYEAVSKITLVQTMEAPPPPSAADAADNQQAPAPVDDIWNLDEKLAAIDSPELRAALRRFGTSIEDETG